MTRILLVGYDPDRVDFSDPTLPPGLTPEKIQAGITEILQNMRDRGWTADHCFIRPDGMASDTLERWLASEAAYDCVVIGAGVRLARDHLDTFEAVINTVHRAAPTAAIAFNTRPEDSLEAAERVLNLHRPVSTHAVSP